MEKRNPFKTNICEPEEDLEESEKPERKIVRNALDLQRIKIEKLMKNPEKPVVIPEIHKEKDFVYSVPSFVRNVMGSSAGAGSGEFHVYRNLRRKEYARQKIIELKSHKECLDQDYRDKIEKNRLEAEAKTAKKRAKRLKKKKTHHKKTKTNTEINEKNMEVCSTDSNDEFENSEEEKSETIEDLNGKSKVESPVPESQNENNKQKKEEPEILNEEDKITSSPTTEAPSEKELKTNVKNRCLSIDSQDEKKVDGTNTITVE